MSDKSEIVRMNISLILMEQQELSEKITEYNHKTSEYILQKEPKTEVEYKLAELQAQNKYEDLLEKIIKKEYEIESHKRLLEHKDEVIEAYQEFKEENKELAEMIEKFEKLFGDD